MSDADRQVPIEKLRWVCEPSQFSFASTADIAIMEGSIGQARALAAIDFGLGMANNGFNLYLAGEPGTGRSSTICSILKRRAREGSPPSDWCYVHNFTSPDAPLALSLHGSCSMEKH